MGPNVDIFKRISLLTPPRPSGHMGNRKQPGDPSLSFIFPLGQTAESNDNCLGDLIIVNKIQALKSEATDTLTH